MGRPVLLAIQTGGMTGRILSQLSKKNGGSGRLQRNAPGSGR